MDTETTSKVKEFKDRLERTANLVIPLKHFIVSTSSSIYLKNINIQAVVMFIVLFFRLTNEIRRLIRKDSWISMLSSNVVARLFILELRLSLLSWGKNDETQKKCTRGKKNEKWGEREREWKREQNKARKAYPYSIAHPTAGPSIHLNEWKE